MWQAGDGSIITIGSIEGLAANPDHAVDAAPKAGIHGMTRALAVDLGLDNIRYNAIASGWIASELSENYPAVSNRIPPPATHCTGCIPRAAWASPGTSSNSQFSWPVTARAS